MIGYGIYFYINLLLAQILAPAVYGDFILVLYLLIFLTPVAALGINLSVKRFIPDYLAQGHVKQARSFLLWAALILLLLCLVVLIIAAIFTGVFILLDYHNFYGLDKLHPFFYALWIIPLFAIISVLSNFLLALQRNVAAAISRRFALYTAFLIVFYVLVEWTDHISVYHALLALGLASLLVIVFQLLVAWVVWRKQIKTASVSVSEAPIAEARTSWLAISKNQMFSAMTYTALLAIDIVMIETLAHNEDIVGHFAAVLVIASSLFILTGVTNTLLLPRLGELLSQRQSLQRILSRSFLFNGLVMLVLAGLIWHYQYPILHLFGWRYDHLGTALTLMLIANFVTAITSITGPLLHSSDHVRLNVRLRLLELALMIILDVVLIPYYGLLGAIHAYLVTTVIISLLRVIFVRWKLKLRCLVIA